MHNADIVIHIDESLDDDSIHQLEQSMGSEPGVLSACMHERTRHLMVVDFDPERVRPSNIVHSVRGRGFHAEMLGL
jgi:hypothetical protein